MIHHNFLHWLICISWSKSVRQQHPNIHYTSHEQPSVDSKRIENMIELLLIERYDILYRLFHSLDLTLKSRNDENSKENLKYKNIEIDDTDPNMKNKISKEVENKIMLFHICKNYQSSWFGTFITLMLKTPINFVLFYARLFKYNNPFVIKLFLSKLNSKNDCIDWIDTSKIDFLSDLINFFEKYINHVSNLLKYLSLNRKKPKPIITCNKVNESNDTPNGSKSGRPKILKS